jgi:hypothetical protein
VCLCVCVCLYRRCVSPSMAGIEPGSSARQSLDCTAELRAVGARLFLILLLKLGFVAM